MAGTVGKVNPFLYRGYYYDNESGLYYLNSRYYDPQTGRFINADGNCGAAGNIQSHNMFEYCSNNPINMSDETGHWPQWINNAVNAVVGVAKKVANAVVKVVKSVASSVYNIIKSAKSSSNSLPKTGNPNSNKTLHNPDGTPKQKRWYGPDGIAERDRDYNHPSDMPFPHDHDWPNGQRNKNHLPPSPFYEFSWEPVLGVGLVVVCVVGMALVAANDATGIGVADDFLFAPLDAGAGKGLIMIFG